MRSSRAAVHYKKRKILNDVQRQKLLIAINCSQPNSRQLKQKLRTTHRIREKCLHHRKLKREHRVYRSESSNQNLTFKMLSATENSKGE